MAKSKKPKFGPNFYDDPTPSSDAVMHRERAHKDWYYVARRLGDHRGYIAHGKAKTQTSGRVKKDSGHS